MARAGPPSDAFPTLDHKAALEEGAVRMENRRQQFGQPRRRRAAFASTQADASASVSFTATIAERLCPVLFPPNLHIAYRLGFGMGLWQLFL
jgi:hypothetical protein